MQLQQLVPRLSVMSLCTLHSEPFAVQERYLRCTTDLCSAGRNGFLEFRRCLLQGAGQGDGCLHRRMDSCAEQIMCRILDAALFSHRSGFLQERAKEEMDAYNAKKAEAADADADADADGDEGGGSVGGDESD